MNPRVLVVAIVVTLIVCATAGVLSKLTVDRAPAPAIPVETLTESAMPNAIVVAEKQVTDPTDQYNLRRLVGKNVVINYTQYDDIEEVKVLDVTKTGRSVGFIRIRMMHNDSYDRLFTDRWDSKRFSKELVDEVVPKD